MHTTASVASGRDTPPTAVRVTFSQDAFEPEDKPERDFVGTSEVLSQGHDWVFQVLFPQLQSCPFFLPGMLSLRAGS